MKSFSRIVILLLFLILNETNGEDSFILNEEYTICEENGTCSTYDDVLNSTETNMFSTSFEEINQTITEEKNKTIENDLRPIKKTICFCDLKRDYCDLECCCDTDCTSEQKLVFARCEIGLPNSYDSRYCYSNDYIYVNNTPTSIEVAQKELFCIMSSNLPPSYSIQANKPVKSIQEAEKLMSKYYKWPIFKNKAFNKFNITEVFKSGNNVWIRHNSSTIEPFYVAKSVITNVCLGKKPVKFLENYKSSCSQMINEDISENLNPLTYYEFTVISYNSSFNYSTIQNISEECHRYICKPIKIHLCDQSYLNCEQVKTNDTRLSHACHFSLYSNELTCTQIVKKVKYVFFHNGTQGYTRIHLYLHLTNITFYTSSENEQFEQFFEIDFQWETQKQNYSSLLSGNPGYLIGKPVLLANVNCSTYNETNGDFEFVQNGNNIFDNFLILPDNVNGYCRLDNETYKLVDFGYNIRLSCKDKFETKNISDPDICNNLQKQIFDLWNISSENNSSFKYIATFGNSDRYKVDEWIEMMYKLNINETLNNISSQHVDQNKFICNNLVNTLQINILYSYVDFDKAKYQKKILNVFLEFQTKNIVFDIDDKLNMQDLTVDFKVFTEVMFYDVTAPNIKKFVDPPSFEIRIPPDFFYPFMSAAKIIIRNNILTSICILCLAQF